MKLINILRSHRALWQLLIVLLVGSIFGLTLGGWWAYENIPSVHYRAQIVWAKAFDVIKPQVETLPTSGETRASPIFSLLTPTMTLATTPTPRPLPATSSAVGRINVPTANPILVAPLPSPTAYPKEYLLAGFRYEKQYFNNCGPTTLAMTLSYWGWAGNQFDPMTVLRPNQDDKNVSPEEFQRFLQTIGFASIVRVNGDALTLERFIAAGYPVIIEKGLTCEADEERCSGWVGHYSLIIGYNGKSFTLQDSFRGAGIKLSYREVLDNWRAFNYTYVVVFPDAEQHRTKVLSLLGRAADQEQNYQDALARAQAETANNQWSAAAFAWFNVGTNLTYLGDYPNAALAYDQARNAGLSPHLLWYQFGLFRAYYEAGRYADVEHLASYAIDSAHLTGVEEDYYWRGKAREALGQREQALSDYHSALNANPTFQPAGKALTALGEVP